MLNSSTPSVSSRSLLQDTIDSGNPGGLKFDIKFNIRLSQFKSTKFSLNSSTKTRPTQEAPGA